MNPPTVVNRYKEDFDIYIGRGSMWGNPYKLEKESDRSLVIEQYRKYLFAQIKCGKITKHDFSELTGKRLGCFCKPKACHGDVIVNAYEWIMNQND